MNPRNNTDKKRFIAKNLYRTEIWLEFNASICTVCGWCLDVCPHGVFSLNLHKQGDSYKKKLEIDIHSCIPCRECYEVCKPKAISNVSFNSLKFNIIYNLGYSALILPKSSIKPTHTK